MNNKNEDNSDVNMLRPKKSTDKYRGVQTMNNAPFNENNEKPLPLDLNSKYHSTSTVDAFPWQQIFSPPTIKPQSTSSVYQSQTFQPEPNDAVKDTKEEKEEIQFVESKIPKMKDKMDIEFYNEHSSCTIDLEPCKIMESLEELLIYYSNEIEYDTDKANSEIEGKIYIRHRPICFVISVWFENNKTSRVEFQNRQGNRIDFQLFWNDMLGKMQQRFQGNNLEGEHCNDFSDYFMPTFNIEIDISYNELLDELNEQLIDDYHEIALDSLGLLCSRLENDTKFRDSALKHKNITLTLTNNIIHHVDSSHKRGALKALWLLAEASNQYSNQLIQQYQILNTLFSLLKHDKMLIRKHSIRLLALLSNYSWPLLPNHQITLLTKQLDLLKIEYGKDKTNFVSTSMVDVIQQRIVLV